MAPLKRLRLFQRSLWGRSPPKHTPSPPKWQSTNFWCCPSASRNYKSFEWLFSLFKWCMGGCRKLRCILFTHLFVRSNLFSYSPVLSIIVVYQYARILFTHYIFDSCDYLLIKFDHNTCLPWHLRHHMFNSLRFTRIVVQIVYPTGCVIIMNNIY